MIPVTARFVAFIVPLLRSAVPDETRRTGTRKDDAPRSDIHHGGAVMAWVLWFLAGLLEIAWSVGMKFSEGFTRLWPSLGTVAGIAASMALLALAVRNCRSAPPTGCGWASARWALRCWA